MQTMTSDNELEGLFVGLAWTAVPEELLFSIDDEWELGDHEDLD
jgi:hypothetical protein